MRTMQSAEALKQLQVANSDKSWVEIALRMETERRIVTGSGGRHGRPHSAANGIRGAQRVAAARRPHTAVGWTPLAATIPVSTVSTVSKNEEKERKEAWTQKDVSTICTNVSVKRPKESRSRVVALKSNSSKDIKSKTPQSSTLSYESVNNEETDVLLSIAARHTSMMRSRDECAQSKDSQDETEKSKRRMSTAETKLAEHIEKINRMSISRRCSFLQAGSLPQQQEKISVQDTENDKHKKLGHNKRPLGSWKERVARAQRRRHEFEVAKTQHAREALARVDDRQQREQLRERQRRVFVTIAILGQATGYLCNELRGDRDRIWQASEAVQVSGDAGTTDHIQNQTSADSPGESTGHSPIQRPTSGGTRASKRSAAVAARRRLRAQHAVHLIQNWWFDRKVWRTLKRAGKCATLRLQSFVLKSEQNYRAVLRARAVAQVIKFLLAMRRSGLIAMRRLLYAVKQVQCSIRYALRCRVARIGLLDRAYQREERLYREQLVKVRRKAEIDAVARMYHDPVFGWRTAKLYNTKRRLKTALARVPKIPKREGEDKTEERTRRPSTAYPSSRRRSSTLLPLLSLDAVNEEIAVDPELAPCPALARRIVCDNILRDQRRKYLREYESRLRCAGPHTATVAQVKRLFFAADEFEEDQNPHSNMKRKKKKSKEKKNTYPCVLCTYDKKGPDLWPFLLLTGGALEEIRTHIRLRLGPITPRARPNSASPPKSNSTVLFSVEDTRGPDGKYTPKSHSNSAANLLCRSL